MNREFPEVMSDDFMKITTDRLPHQDIEMTLMNLGENRPGGGTEFKNKVMKAAGWKKMRLSTYAGDPDMAASAFNRVRIALAKTQDPDALMQLVSGDE